MAERANPLRRSCNQRPQGNRSEAVPSLDDERPVEIEGDTDQAARQGENTEEEEARCDKMPFPGGEAGEQPGEKAAEQDRQGEQIVAEPLQDPEPGVVARVAGNLPQRLPVDRSSENLRDLAAVETLVANMEGIERAAHQKRDGKNRQKENHETVPVDHCLSCAGVLRRLDPVAAERFGVLTPPLSSISLSRKDSTQ